MADTSRDGILRRIRITLQQGRAVGFVGWRHTYHDEYTRIIPSAKVVFTNSTAPPAHVGIIFFTPNVDRKLVGKIAKNRSVMHTLLEPGDIRALLKECNDLIGVTATPAPIAPTTGDHDEVLDWLTKPLELSTMEKFAQAFLAEAAKNDDRVGRRTLGELIRKHHAESVPKLLAGGWITSEIAPGKKRVGWYLAGAKMDDLQKKAVILPEDPLERARFLVAQKDALIAEKQKIEAMLAEVNGKLERVEKIVQAIDHLSKLMK